MTVLKLTDTDLWQRKPLLLRRHNFIFRRFSKAHKEQASTNKEMGKIMQKFKETFKNADATERVLIEETLIRLHDASSGMVEIRTPEYT